jgi:hypothetical protein
VGKHDLLIKTADAGGLVAIYENAFLAVVMARFALNHTFQLRSVAHVVV